MQDIEPIKPRFDEAAREIEEIRIRRRIDEMNRPLVKRAYERLEKREKAKLEDLGKDLDRNRDREVKELAREALDRRVKEASNAPKPKWAPGPSRDELNKAARRDAEAEYARKVQTELARAREKADEERRKFLARIEGDKSHKEAFNDIASRRHLRENFREASEGRGR
ncbi:hypothetical protein HAHE_25020 [Haloferula helveola]|uniref:Uncharacterized protein n=1 Tax=Haloferula helveola TaxID=490095 RepID=A0ABN6H7Q3_9BACT|nr:hypothetical protein HAHE_25020 [Haloferula helveola]